MTDYECRAPIRRDVGGAIPQHNPLFEIQKGGGLPIEGRRKVKLRRFLHREKRKTAARPHVPFV